MTTAVKLISIPWMEPRYGHPSRINIIRTSLYNGLFRFSRRKSLFYLKLTCSTRTPVNTDNGPFSHGPQGQTPIYRQPRFTDLFT